MLHERIIQLTYSPLDKPKLERAWHKFYFSLTCDGSPKCLELDHEELVISDTHKKKMIFDSHEVNPYVSISGPDVQFLNMLESRVKCYFKDYLLSPK